MRLLYNVTVYSPTFITSHNYIDNLTLLSITNVYKVIASIKPFTAPMMNCVIVTNKHLSTKN